MTPETGTAVFVLPGFITLLFREPANSVNGQDALATAVHIFAPSRSEAGTPLKAGEV